MPVKYKQQEFGSPLLNQNASTCQKSPPKKRNIRTELVKRYRTAGISF
ncbi:hypothetical protein ACE1CI_36215 [Aerosakkonemataceae cyanobacterium BLCC-F50]|uniref:Uncharacterized protein n=1 Tax=Floridaenema flaviceps BLCC-F50 TaxID=3153642 RepID=A0ABV4Y318_9CYAN